MKFRKKVCADLDALNKIKAVLHSWTIGSYDSEEIEHLKRIAIPEKYQTFSGTLYRGERFDRLAYNDLKADRLHSYGLSWTTDEEIAKKFALDNDSDYGVVWKYTPKAKEILLNVEAFLADNSDITLPYGEKEILLHDNINLNKNSIKCIVLINKEAKSKLPDQLLTFLR